MAKNKIDKGYRIFCDAGVLFNDKEPEPFVEAILIPIEEVEDNDEPMAVVQKYIAEITNSVEKKFLRIIREDIKG